MKIGQVVQRYGVPVNTLYFYINSGLLVPPRRNSQYVFDQHTLEELEWLLELKELEFPLKTIHRLLSLRRISNFCSEEDRRELRAIFQEQADELKRRQAQISAARQQVGRKLFELESSPAAGTRTGVPVSMLHLLRCPNCGGELMLENANMSPKYVFQAVLRCGCGYSAAIRDGILQTKNVNTSLFDKPDTTRELYRDLPSMTLSLYERSYRWLEENIRSGVSHGKVWLEGYVNAWFFFHNHLELLDSSDQLVVIDKFPETLLAYKAVIEQQNLPCDILYISDCSASPPLRENIIDCVMDFFAVNEHNFYHGDFYLNQLLPYLSLEQQLALAGVGGGGLIGGLSALLGALLQIAGQGGRQGIAGLEGVHIQLDGTALDVQAVFLPGNLHLGGGPGVLQLGAGCLHLNLNRNSGNLNQPFHCVVRAPFYII